MVSTEKNAPAKTKTANSPSTPANKANPSPAGPNKEMLGHAVAAVANRAASHPAAPHAAKADAEKGHPLPEKKPSLTNAANKTSTPPAIVAPNVVSTQGGVKSTYNAVSVVAKTEPLVHEAILSVSPVSLLWTSTMRQFLIDVTNKGKDRRALKVKCSDTSTYRIFPVYWYLAAGESGNLTVNTDAPVRKNDKIVIQHLPVPNDHLPHKLPELFAKATPETVGSILITSMPADAKEAVAAVSAILGPSTAGAPATLSGVHTIRPGPSLMSNVQAMQADPKFSLTSLNQQVMSPMPATLKDGKKSAEVQKDDPNISVVPTALLWQPTIRQLRLDVANKGKERRALKVKCSDTAVYKIYPVFWYLSPGEIGHLTVSVESTVKKNDKLVIQHVIVPNDHLPHKLPELFAKASADALSTITVMSMPATPQPLKPPPPPPTPLETQQTNAEAMSISKTVLVWELGGVWTQSIVLKNLSKARRAAKIKCSDNKMYVVNPVFVIVAPGKDAAITFTRNGTVLKDDKFVVQHVQADGAFAPLTAPDVFKVANPAEVVSLTIISRPR